VTDHPANKPVSTHIAKLIRSAFGWNDARKAMIAADGRQAISASREFRRTSRELAEAVDIAAQKGGDA
jgi:hypothetical protein